MRGIVFPNAAQAFLAARTEDLLTRAALAEASSRSEALRIARRGEERRDWRIQRPEIAQRILRMAYRGERRARLVDTLPFALADDEVFDVLLIGIEGRAGLQALMSIRGEFAAQAAKLSSQPSCGRCIFASESRVPGFFRCEHPDGISATLKCTQNQAFADPSLSVHAIVSVKTEVGVHFKQR